MGGGEGSGKHSGLSHVHAKPAPEAAGLDGQQSRTGFRTDAGAQGAWGEDIGHAAGISNLDATGPRYSKMSPV